MIAPIKQTYDGLTEPEEASGLESKQPLPVFILEAQMAEVVRPQRVAPWRVWLLVGWAFAVTALYLARLAGLW